MGGLVPSEPKGSEHSATNDCQIRHETEDPDRERTVWTDSERCGKGRRGPRNDLHHSPAMDRAELVDRSAELHESKRGVRNCRGSARSARAGPGRPSAVGLTRIHRHLHVTDIGSGLALIAQRKETPEFVLTRAEYMFGSAFDGT